MFKVNVQEEIQRIGASNPCFIIVEIGQNHQGDIKIRKKMSKAWGPTYGAHKRHLEFSHQQYRELQRYADDIRIFFTASGMDEKHLCLCLSCCSSAGRPMVISSGMQSMETMRCVYQTVKKHNPNFTFLQCTSAYPLPAEHINLSLIPAFQKEFPDIPIGYSGHETGILVSVAAVALGAKVLDRHVTLDKTWKGSDHAASLEPAELAELVKAIRTVEMAMGSPVKETLPCEASCHSKLGKSVVARRPLLKGVTLSLDILAAKVAEPHGVAPKNTFRYTRMGVQYLTADRRLEAGQDHTTITDTNPAKHFLTGPEFSHWHPGWTCVVLGLFPRV
ncbi:Sialic acid synthase N-acetylneuraminate synthase [Triplophysa tibetana]|uniref:Sialic acid synthase N-acetylneuraminate synthase n=1 Tax=Triplophysa tibetana TaxID=1572043 RepID=A0A5A9PSR3_9TELE|nr:Sialic acid synthase N-acetylneuraminate synthase [Triplophysa tibetana]